MAPTATEPVKLPQGEPLVDALASWRRETARTTHVPPYRVLPNAALLAVARERPRTLSALLGVKGLGPWRVERFGISILDIVARHPDASEPDSP